MSTTLPNPLSLIEYDGMRFLVFDAPNDDNLPLYMAVCVSFSPRFFPQKYKKTDNRSGRSTT